MAVGSGLGLPRALAAIILLLFALNVAQFLSRDREPQPGLPPLQQGHPEEAQSESSLDLTDQEITDLYFLLLATKTRGLRTSHFFGVQTLQNPLDVWITQEIIYETKPDVILDIGTHRGGSAALWAVILEHVSPGGRVISIDIEDQVTKAKELPIVQRSVDFLVGSSTAPEIIEEVKTRVAGRKVLVILDSLHEKDHVLAELEAYAPMVPVGGYVIVQDTLVDRDDPVWKRAIQTRGWSRGIKPGSGPGAAVQAFLSDRDDFVIDKSRERYLVTNNWNGFLKRVK